MEVILIEDVKSLGKKGEKYTLKDGYARSLIAKKQALEATAKNMNDLKLRQKHQEKLEEQRLAEAKALAEKMKDLSITVSVKLGEGGRVFGSVSTKEIADEAEKQLSLKLDKKKIVLAEPIKTIGTTKVPVKLHPQVTGELAVKVVEK